MSVKEISEILDRVKTLNSNPETSTNKAYNEHVFQSFLLSKHSREWNARIITGMLEKALIKGFHGIHFIPLNYIAVVDRILEHYLGEDHAVAYRRCERHNYVILQPDYKKLGIIPNKMLVESYSLTSPKYIIMANDDIKRTYADFCFE